MPDSTILRLHEETYDSSYCLRSHEAISKALILLTFHHSSAMRTGIRNAAKILSLQYNLFPILVQKIEISFHWVLQASAPHL